MRKLIFGIIAVICVQFAFVNFMELESPLDLAVGPVQTAPPEATDRDLRWIEELDRSAMLPPESEAPLPDMELEREVISRNEQNESLDRPARSRSAEAQRSTPAKRPVIYFPVATEDRGSNGFETVVISYNRSPEVSDCEKYEVPKVKRRSFMAKAIPVAKKPWEWVKSVGSKLY